MTALGSDAVSLVTTSATGSFANKNVGNAKAVTASGYALTGLDASNYTLVQPSGLTANITPVTYAEVSYLNDVKLGAWSQLAELLTDVKLGAGLQLAEQSDLANDELWSFTTPFDANK